jgi:endonuclease/exonuclease/phosphatase family metal-dependent hydrolase
MTALISPPSSGVGASLGARRSVQVVPQQTAHVTPVSLPRRRTAQDPAARDLRVMSFNVRLAIFIDAMNHWGFRKGLVVETIRKFDPDLLGTQEALAGQSDYLRGQLSDYDFVGAGRNDGGRSGEMCGVFFRRARFDKIDAGHFWLSERPDEPGSKSWGTSFTRMCTWVKLRDRADGSVMCLFNTHFDHRGKRAREQAARLLRRKVDQIAGALPVVITGDFNTDENTPPYRTLLAGTRAGDERFVDTFRAHDRVPDRAEGTRHDFWGGRDGPRIDWIVTDGSFQTVSASIDHTSAGGRYPSDHFPVTAVLRPAASSSMGVARVE